MASSGAHVTMRGPVTDAQAAGDLGNGNMSIRQLANF
jgi:hypothetical protein